MEQIINDMEIDFQFFVNVMIGLLSVFCGYVLRNINEKVSGVDKKHTENSNFQEKEIQRLMDQTRSDYKEINGKMTEMAVSFPDKYVSKSDFREFVDGIFSRLDRLENKIDFIHDKHHRDS